MPYINNGKRCDSCLIRLAFEGLTTAVVLTDMHCRITFLNRAAEEIFGLSPKVLSKPLHHLITQQDLLAAWTEACTSNKPVMALVRLTKPVERFLRVTVGLCYAPDGSLMGRALLACDVTEDRKVVLELTAELAQALLGRVQDGNGQAKPMEALTPAEWKVLKFLGEGLSNAAIAHRLAISHNTLRTHLKNIYRKLDLPDRNAAVAYAAQLRAKALV